MIGVRESGDALSEDELMSLALLVLLAGFENTVHLIGNAVLALLQYPEQLAMLRDDPAGPPDAVEELARFEGPALPALRTLLARLPGLRRGDVEPEWRTSLCSRSLSALPVAY